MYLVSCKTTDRTNSTLQANDGIRPATFTGYLGVECTGVDNKCRFWYNVINDQEVKSYIACVGTRDNCKELTKTVMSNLKDKKLYHEPLIPAKYANNAKYYQLDEHKNLYEIQDFTLTDTYATCYYVTALRFSSKNPTAVMIGRPIPNKKCTDIETEDITLE